jgi:hypothetical protein
MSRKRKPRAIPEPLPSAVARRDDPEGAMIIAAIQRAFEDLAALGPLVAPDEYSTSDAFKRGPWIGDAELDPIREAWRPILTDSEMQMLTSEGRWKLQLEILQKVANVRTERDRRWLESLRKADWDLLVEWVNRTDRDRQSGAKSREGGAKGTAARGSTTDRANCLAVVRELGVPPKNTVATLLKNPRIHHFVTMYSETAVRGWIRQIDERPKEKRRGRPRSHP